MCNWAFTKGSDQNITEHPALGCQPVPTPWDILLLGTRSAVRYWIGLTAPSTAPLLQLGCTRGHQDTKPEITSVTTRKTPVCGFRAVCSANTKIERLVYGHWAEPAHFCWYWPGGVMISLICASLRPSHQRRSSSRRWGRVGETSADRQDQDRPVTLNSLRPENIQKDRRRACNETWRDRGITDSPN